MRTAPPRSESNELESSEPARVDVVARATEPTRPIQLSTNEPGPHVVRGDATRLRQALDNLLTNIREHTPDRTPARIKIERTGGQITISVTDQGPGMSPEDAGHAFERFYQAAGDNAQRGTGLGLAITAAITEAHQGRIDLDTRLGHGATFTIHLPAAD